MRREDIFHAEKQTKFSDILGKIDYRENNHKTQSNLKVLRDTLGNSVSLEGKSVHNRID